MLCITYVVEAPVWKATYRLDLGDKAGNVWSAGPSSRRPPSNTN